MEWKEDGEEKKNEEVSDRSPAQKYDLYVLSDELSDKLKLLNYEEDYAKLAPSCRTVSREYFVKSTNIGEQFFIFTTLSAWLIQKSIDPTFIIPQEFDDPNGTILSILSALRSKNVSIAFAPNKLKTGAGEQCLYVLDKLADFALIAGQFCWTKADPVPEDDEVDEAVNRIEITAEEQQPLNGILHSDTNVNSWKLEVERVAPRLKVTFEKDSKDWRMHLGQIRSLQKTVAELLSTTEPHLESISKELDKTMGRIINREKHFNSQLEPVLTKFCHAKERMTEVEEKYKEISSGILDRTQKLQRVNDELEQIKQQIDEKSLRNSDGVPMLRLKQALQKMESEILTMNVQISVMEQSLLQSQLKNLAAYNAHLQDLHI
uniref:Uncharacterized protein n=1 Tax=Wuchereria bancrofti TaxID=6293 RepID=A0A1I8ETU9_WUCBA